MRNVSWATGLSRDLRINRDKFRNMPSLGMPLLDSTFQLCVPKRS